MIYSLVTSIIVIFLVSIGLYAATYKRKVNQHDNVIPKYFKYLPIEAQNVHTKELNKQTYPSFTWKWFLEYWRGERSAFNAWLIWSFIGSFLVSTIGLLFIFFLKFIGFSGLSVSISFTILFLMYSILSSIILWRCAKNSTTNYKFFARSIAILPLVDYVIQLWKIILY